MANFILENCLHLVNHVILVQLNATKKVKCPYLTEVAVMDLQNPYFERFVLYLNFAPTVIILAYFHYYDPLHYWCFLL